MSQVQELVATLGADWIESDLDESRYRVLVAGATSQTVAISSQMLGVSVSKSKGPLCQPRHARSSIVSRHKGAAAGL